MKNKTKSIKILIIITFVIIIFSGSKSELFSQSFCYDQFGQDCTPYWTTYNQWLIIPEFPQCSLYVNYKTRVCNNEVQIYIEGIWVPNEFEMSTPCNFYSCMYPDWPIRTSVNYNCIKMLFAGAFNKLSDNIFTNKTGTYTDLQKDGYLCGSGNWVCNVTYFRDVCDKFCWMEYNGQNPPPFPNLNYPVIHICTTSCTEEYCCRNESKYCYEKIWDDLQGKYVYIVHITREKTTPGGEVDCDTYNGPNSSIECPTGYFSSECMPTCITE